MRDTSFRARILCFLGFHAWHGMTLSGEDYEARVCRKCSKAQCRPISISGHPLGRWEELELEPREVLY